jgi:UDP-glucose:glycoprotein glucosyltransferase
MTQRWMLAVLALVMALGCARGVTARDSSKGVSVTLTTEWRVRSRSGARVPARLPPPRSRRDPRPAPALESASSPFLSFLNNPPQATSSLLEAAEFFADEGVGAYWSFLARWREETEADSGASEQSSCADDILAAAEGLAASDETIGLLKLSLGIRRYSPRLEMFRALAEEEDDRAVSGDARTRDHPCCRVLLGDDRADSVDALRDMLADANLASARGATLPPRGSEMDHPYPPPPETSASDPSSSATATGSRGGALPVATLVAAPGTPCFAAFHDVLAARADAGAIRYRHRPVLRPGCVKPGTCVALGSGEGPGDRLAVSGYGVGMAVKNMEYTSGDDGSEVRVDSGEVDDADDDADDAGDEELDEDADAPLRVRDIKDLGLQATQRIVSSRDPLREMVDVSQNFPSLAGSLSRLKLDPEVRAEAAQNAERLGPDGGSLVMSLNGAPLEMDTVDVFALTEKVAAEVKAAAALARVGDGRLDAEAIAALLRARVPGGGAGAGGGSGSSLPRLRLPDEIVAFAVDVERDRAFEAWSPNLEQLLMPSGGAFGGGPPPVRRNMFNVVLIVDLAMPVAWSTIDALERYVEAGVPLRIAHVLMESSREDGPDADTARVSEDARALAAMLGLDPDHGGDDRAARADPDLPANVTLGAALARAGTLLQRRFGAKAAHEFVRELGDARPIIRPGSPFSLPTRGVPTWAAASDAFASVFPKGFRAAEKKAKRARPSKHAVEAALAEALSDVLSTGEDAATPSSSASLVAATRRALARAGATSPAALVNGAYFTRLDALKMGGDLDRVAAHLIQTEAQDIARAVYSGALTDAAADAHPGGLYGWLHRAAATKITPWVVDLETYPPTFAAMRPPGQHPAEPGERVPLLTYAPRGEDGASSSAGATVGTTLWIVADAGAPGGAALVAAANELAGRYPGGAEAELEGGVRVATLHAPGAPPSAGALEAARVGRADPGEADAALLERQAEFAAATLGAATVEAAFGAGLDSDAPVASAGVVVANGRVAIVPPGVVADADDLALLASREWDARGRDVLAVVEASASRVDGARIDDANDTEPVALSLSLSDVAMAACSLVAIRQASPGGARGQVSDLSFLESRRVSFWVPGAGASVLEAVLDPLSPEAQRVAPVLVALRDALAPHLGVRVILNPRVGLDDLPLKSYYRYAAPAWPTPAPGPEAKFTSLPPRKTLTAHLDVPEQWLVTTAKAAYDLDNIKLEDLPPAQRYMRAEYRLEALLVTGHCDDLGAREPPRGAQLVLSRWDGSASVGTVVMSNLGYFQLPAAPGGHSLALRPGRSADVFAIAGDVVDLEEALGRAHAPGEAADSGDGGSAAAADVFVSGWSGRVVRLTLRRRPGMERADVLDDGGERGGERGDGGAAAATGGTLANAWASVTGLFRGGSSAAGAGGRIETHPGAKALADDRRVGETIHVFSVASGHLYERFLKIMMLSVRRGTRNPVKFWFIKNWLSPRFKDFVPAFAEAHGFEYELVTYKWPTWLNKQTEKQRIIWAYKLLFLDVLFPLSLNKVIFVDADQVVRADLKELWEMDLRGAPYAYTPFCDNNKEMEGYRFWKTGFWKSHLAGKPYHISALYVVDLDRFRRTAAGDRLRVIYEQLSKDPGSLANLDQDLPNYAQHQVPIRSLPQNWLWCESWCGNETKADAKTIDLCNNPMTKEPKLKGAARIVAEWPALDAEVRAFTADVEKKIYGQAQAETPQERDARVDAEKAAQEESDWGGDVAGGAARRDEL